MLIHHKSLNLQAITHRTAQGGKEVPNPNAGEPYEPDTIVLGEPPSTELGDDHFGEPYAGNPGHRNAWVSVEPEGVTLHFAGVPAPKADSDQGTVPNPHAGEPYEPEYLIADSAPRKSSEPFPGYA